MTLEEAERIINPETTLEAYAETDYYGGFEGSKRWKKAVDEATVIAAQALREKIEREKGCCVCTGDYRIQRKPENAGYRHCPNCGRKLR